MPQSASDKTLAERIENDFTYHPPRGDQPQLYDRVRGSAKAFALVIASMVPEGREKSLALTKLEEAVHWANAGIARAS